MNIKGIFAALLAALCVLTPVGVSAAEVDSDTVYCFSPADFSEEEQLAGICITSLPEAEAGTVMLGQRVLRPGDILQLED